MIDRILELLQLVRKSYCDYLHLKYRQALKDYDIEVSKNNYLKSQNKTFYNENELLKSELSKAKLEIIELKKKNEELESLPKVTKLPSPKRIPIQKRSIKSTSKESFIVKRTHI